MPDWVLVKNDAGMLDRFGQVHPFLSQYGKPIPYLRDKAPTNRGAWQPIPEQIAWACAEQLLRAGGEIGEPEAAAIGLTREAVC